MEQISTPDLHRISRPDDGIKRPHASVEAIGPKASTIAFLQQLARCYVPVKGATGPLSAIVAN